MHGLRDPYAYLLQELNDRDTGRRPPWAPGQRQDLIDDLLVIEALELAHGKRHLSIVFDSSADSDRIGQLIAAIEDAVSDSDGFRLTGANGRLTVSLVGPEAAERLGKLERDLEERLWPGDRLATTPRA
jgi:hypothetical protein